MQFRFNIADKLAALTELDVLQVQRIAFLQLLEVEEHIYRVSFEIKPYLCEDFECKYRADWTIELQSGHVISYRRTDDSIGAAVLASAGYMKRKVMRRISFENTIASRVLTAVTSFGGPVSRRNHRTASCA